MSQQDIPVITLTSPRLSTREIVETPTYYPMRRRHRPQTAEPGLLSPNVTYAVLRQLQEENETLKRENMDGVVMYKRDMEHYRAVMFGIQGELATTTAELFQLRETADGMEERLCAAERELALWRAGRDGRSVRERSPLDERRERSRVERQR